MGEQNICHLPLDEPLVAAVSQLLDSAGVANVLWGNYLLTVYGISSLINLDFLDWQAIDYDPDKLENYFTEEALEMSRKNKIHLKTLEVQYTVSCEDHFSEGEQLLTFLHAFNGLEELFVSTSGSLNAVNLWRAALNHGATLKRFVHHQRTVDLDDKSVYFKEQRDLLNLLFKLKTIKQLS
ncbi:hypothetical protein AJ78_05816 [Emergomyces pasteurianus Ep9510]|uniref:Uncharacterized protein n=1 Tax=Emergomyces pasteurianus Ep9510 TaxID=1447872 RepID=A0A1J9PCJ6_9EURO|nr:hypothetical protein AJ78_05816 [Emergomyces pasteurianus Ep9510]